MLCSSETGLERVNSCLEPSCERAQRPEKIEFVGVSQSKKDRIFISVSFFPLTKVSREITNDE